MNRGSNLAGAFGRHEREGEVNVQRGGRERARMGKRRCQSEVRKPQIRRGDGEPEVGHREREALEPEQEVFELSPAGEIGLEEKCTEGHLDGHPSAEQPGE
jgi:hypothetical protein